MRKSLFIVVLLVCSIFVHAQEYAPRLSALIPEEVRLIQAYRQNPEPFQRILHDQELGRHHPARPPAPMGPRDIVDVGIEGGSVQFNGKNYGYDPVSFRICRGEVKEIIFRRQNKRYETVVVVAYRADGLHFDIPDQQPGTRAPEHGYLIIGEDPRWSSGEPIPQNDHITARYSRSKADHITFHLRYASARP